MDERNDVSLTFLKCVVRDTCRSKNYMEDAAKRLVALKAPKKLLYDLQQSLQACYQAIKARHINFFLA